MCSLAASGFRVEGGETRDQSCDQATLRERGAASATTRCHPVPAVHLLPHGQIRVLAVGLQIALGRLSRLPEADSQASRDLTRWYGWCGAKPIPGDRTRSGCAQSSCLMSCPGPGAGRHSQFEGYPGGEQSGLLARFITRLLPIIRRSGPRRHIDQPSRDVPSRSPAVQSPKSGPAPGRQRPGRLPPARNDHARLSRQVTVSEFAASPEMSHREAAG